MGLSATAELLVTFYTALCIFVIGDRKDSKFDVQVECAS